MKTIGFINVYTVLSQEILGKKSTDVKPKYDFFSIYDRASDLKPGQIDPESALSYTCF